MLGVTSIRRGASFAFGFTVGTLAGGSVALAAEGAARPVVEVQATTAQVLDMARAHEVDWAQLALAEVSRSPWDLRRPRDGFSVALGTPRALPTMASVATAVVSRGFSVFEVRRDSRLRQRHALMAFVRTNGFKLAWRLEF